MTVGDLIGLLIHLDQEAVVKVWDYPDPNEGWVKAEIHAADEYFNEHEVKEVLII